MTFTKNLVAASAVAVVSAGAVSAGTYTAPVVEAAPVVIVEEASSSSLGSASWPLIIAAIVGIGFILVNNTSATD